MDRVSGEGVAGARVSAPDARASAVTDASGAFDLRALNPGRTHLHTEAAGYRPGSTSLLLRNGEIATARVELDPDPLRVPGVDVSARWTAAAGDALVLDRRALERSAASDLAEALQDVPGVVVTRQGGAGAPAAISIRGSPPGQVLVLLDGIPMHAPLTGSTDASAISLDGVERITILPGARSARFGARALGGVILVELRAPGEGGGRASVSAGSWGTRQVAFGLGGATPPGNDVAWSGRVGGEWRRARSDFSHPVPEIRGGGTAVRRNADVRTVTGHATGRVTLAAADVRVLVDALDLRRGLPGPVAAPTPTARQRQRRITAGATAELTLGLGWALALDGQRQEARYTDPAPPLGPSTDAETVGRSFGARVSTAAGLGPVALQLGAEARQVEVRSTALAPTSPGRQRALGLWLSAGMRGSPFLGWTGSVTGELRADRHTLQSATELSPRLGGSLSMGRWAARASVGSGFSPPSLADQFFQEGLLVRPNPELAPERVRTELTLGADVRLLTTGFLSLGGSVDLYRADVDGMILWFPDHRFVWSPHNFDVTRRGWEAGLDLTLPTASAGVRAGVARSGVEYAGPVLAGQVAYRPAWMGNLSVTFDPTPWAVGLSGRFVGARRTVPGSAANALDPYVTADARLEAGWVVAGWRAESTLRVLNVLNTHAAMIPDYPHPGRSWELELRVNP